MEHGGGTGVPRDLPLGTPWPILENFRLTLVREILNPFLVQVPSPRSFEEGKTVVKKIKGKGTALRCIIN